MPDVPFDGADVAELFFCRLALKYLAQRLKFDRVADGRARAVRLDVSNGLDGNVRIRLRQSDCFGLSIDAGREKRSGPRAVIILPRAANDGINRVAVGQSIGEALEHDYARAIAEHGPRGIGIEGPAVAVLGECSALLIEEPALLRHGDVDASGQSDVALVVEKRAVGLVHGQQGGGTGSVQADRRPAKIEEIGGAKRDVVFLIAVLDGELAGHGKQIRMGEQIGCVVVIVADAGKHADALLRSLRVVPRVFQRLLREFEKDTLLRIHDLGFERTDAKERGIEKICAVDHASSANVVRIVAQLFVDPRPQLLRRKKRDRLNPIAQVAPQLGDIGRARKASAHADDGHAVERAVAFAARIPPMPGMVLGLNQ